MKKFFLYEVFIGFFAGIVSGLFSTGGGMILVPSFIYLLNLDNVKARATSALCILPMVIVGGLFYYKNNYIDWKSGFLCAAGGIIGGIIGAKALNKIPVIILKIIFVLFLLYASYKMIF